MQCPLCDRNAPYEMTDKDDDVVTVEYRCEYSHIIQFILPDFLFTLLVINCDGDELYQFYFDENSNIIKIFSWTPYAQLDLEGTGVERLIEDRYADVIICQHCFSNILELNSISSEYGEYCSRTCANLAESYAEKEN